jgi:hypothetical protein
MKYFTNPLAIDVETPDPFIIRFNGVYYLYFTHPQLLCYSSKNLVDWECEGTIVAKGTFGELVPFAPEVIYLDGIFYLYTSPSGHGHWVLQSESPTGPFSVVTKELGRHIDGSPFIDDDGTLYLYWADDRGIIGAAMESPVQPVDDSLVLKTDIGWTEGPQVIKEGGLYYLTYCGTHFLSKGYRIYGAVSESPLGPFVPTQAEPLLVHTEGPLVGVGHSSTVWGPDLLVRYLAYHNLTANRTRFCNLAPILYDKREFSLLDYQGMEQQYPPRAKPLVWKVLEKNDAQSEYQSDESICLSNAVIEINVRPAASFEILIGGHRLAFDTNGGVELTSKDSQQVKKSAALSFTPSVLHTLVMRSGEKVCSLYWNGRLVLEMPPIKDSQGYITVRSSVSPLELEHCQYSNGKPLSSYGEIAIPLASIADASGSAQIAIPSTARYVIHYLDESEEPSKLKTIQQSLKKGIQPAPITDEGTRYLAIHPLARTKRTQQSFRPLSSYGTHLFGSRWMSHMVVEAELRRNQLGPSGAFGVAFRVSEYALGGAGDDRVLGIDYLVGYSVMIDKNFITLYRHCFGRSVLMQICHTMALGRPISMRIATRQNEIEVNVDDQYTMTIVDDKPLLHGRVGLRHEAALVEWAHIKVTCLD